MLERGGQSGHRRILDYRRRAATGAQQYAEAMELSEFLQNEYAEDALMVKFIVMAGYPCPQKTWRDRCRAGRLAPEHRMDSPKAGAGIRVGRADDALTTQVTTRDLDCLQKADFPELACDKWGLRKSGGALESAFPRL